jgi:hypothetical protein
LEDDGVRRRRLISRLWHVQGTRPAQERPSRCAQRQVRIIRVSRYRRGPSQTRSADVSFRAQRASLEPAPAARSRARTTLSLQHTDDNSVVRIPRAMMRATRHADHRILQKASGIPFPGLSRATWSADCSTEAQRRN